MLDFRAPFERLVQFLYEFILHSVASLLVVGTINLVERLSELLGDVMTVTWQVGTAHQFSAKDVLHWSDLGFFPSSQLRDYGMVYGS